eukprot:2687131-Pyramimonas_sp.AAC.1
MGNRAPRASRPKAGVHDDRWRRVDAAPICQTAYAQIGVTCVSTNIPTLESKSSALPAVSAAPGLSTLNRCLGILVGRLRLAAVVRQRRSEDDRALDRSGALAI